MAKIRKSSKKAGARLKKTSANQKSKKKSTTKKSRKPASRILTKGATRKKPVKPAKKHTQTIKDKHLIAVAASAKDAIIIIDSSGLVSYWNPGAEKIFGYKSKEVIGRKLDECIIPNKYRKAHLKGLAGFTKTGRGKLIGKTFEFEGLKKDGKEFPIELSLSSFKQDGKWYATGIIRDITRRKLLEEALSNSEEQYRLLIENSADCICYISLDARYLYMSPGGIRLNELKGVDEIQGQDCTEDINAEFKVSMKNAIERAKCGETVSLEYVSTTPSGKEIWWESSTNPIKDDKGRVTKLIRFSKDITERKKMEDAVRESETKYRDLVETSQDLIFKCDREGRFVYLNPAWETTLGYKSEEMLGRKFTEFKTPKQAEKDLKVFKSEFEGKEVLGYETVYISKSGTSRNLVFNARLLKDGDGNVIGTQGTAHDITKRKRAEEELKKSFNLTNAIIEGGKDFVFVKDIRGHYIMLNSHATGTFGKTVDETIGKSDMDLFPPHVAKKIMKDDRRILASGKTETFEEDIVAKGVTKTVLVTKGVYRNDQDDIVGLFGIARDITERKRVEKSLQESSRLLEESQRVANLGSYTFHVSSGMWSSSEILDEIFGITDKAFTKDTEGWLQIIHPEQKAEMQSHLMNHVLAKRNKFDKEYRIIRLDNGQERWVHGLGELVLDENQNPVKMIGTIQDITERKKLEQQLIHTEKLSSIGTFVSGVAHELNNPLTAILGYAGLLQDDYENLPQHIKEDLDNIKVQSERASEIVNNLLRFTRKKKPEKSSVKINDILENSISLHEYSLKTSGIEIIKDYEDSLPFIYADVNHLQQVFTNIVLNFHYEITKAHGKGIITIKSKKSGSNIVVNLENDGPPVPKKLLSKIFDPFFTTKKVGEGTGLGLYVSYGIIQDHGGNMWAENIGKSGVRFVITLPIYDEGVEKPELKKGEMTDLQGKRILFVDDEEILRGWITRVLMKEGIAVQSVSSGEEAVNLIEQSKFDIVISDVKMPGMNGLELGRWLHKNRPDYLKRFILATGAIEPEIETYRRQYKCRLITKPFKTQKLLEAISEIILQKE